MVCGGPCIRAWDHRGMYAIYHARSCALAHVWAYATEIYAAAAVRIFGALSCGECTYDQIAAYCAACDIWLCEHCYLDYHDLCRAPKRPRAARHYLALLPAYMHMYMWGGGGSTGVESGREGDVWEGLPATMHNTTQRLVSLLAAITARLARAAPLGI